MLNLYQLFMQIADNYAPQFRTTLIYAVAAAAMQSLAFLTMLPILLLLNRQAAFVSFLPWLGTLLLLVILQIVFKIKEGQFTYRYWHKLIEQKRLELGEILYNMPLLKLKQYSSGELVEIIGGNTVSLVSALNQIGTLFVHLITIPIILVIAIIMISWQMGVILLFACAMMYLLFRLIKRLQKQGLIETTTASNESAARILEYIQGLIVFKVTGHTGKQAYRLQQALANQYSTQNHLNDSQKSAIFTGQAILQITLILLILIGAFLLHHSMINTAVLTTVIVLNIYLSESLGIIAIVNALFENARAAQDKVEDILKQKAPSFTSQISPIHDFSLKFKEVNFSYKNSAALTNISFEIKQNTIVGIVGPSGSGKSTLTQLISGFISPDYGTITIGDVDIAHLSSKELLRYISIVYQDIWLFNDTIKNNILMGNPQASDQQIFDAASAANIHEFILSLPQQYDTQVGDIGVFLSGGEKQRISIARAILKNTPFVILDEPTSSLDSESEYAVQLALEALVKNKTVIVVAHRLSTVKGADHILVMDRGQIVQQGCHDVLLAKTGGMYQRLWQKQYMEG